MYPKGTHLVKIALIGAVLVALANCRLGNPVAAVMENGEGVVPVDYFSGDALDQFDFSAPFSSLFAERDEQKSVGGFLSAFGKKIPANYKIRGATTLAICRFPKLEVNFEKNAIAEFGDLKRLLIGTHCDKDPAKEDPARRLFGPTALAREYLLYRLAEILGVTTSRARLATIRYWEEPGSAHRDSAPVQIIETLGLLLEPHGDVAKRSKADQLKAEDRDKIPRKDLDPTFAAKTHLFNLAIANLDFIFNDISGTMNRSDPVSTYRNIKIMKELGTARLLPYPYDFDISFFVRGFLVSDQVFDEVFDRTYRAGSPIGRRLNGWALDYYFFKHEPSVAKDVLEKFLAKRPQALDLFERAEGDGQWKQEAKIFLNAFFDEASSRL